MSVALRVACFLSLCCFPVGAISQQTDRSIEVGVGVVCDTAKQMERFVALHTTGSEGEVAIGLVNSEAHDGRACGTVAVAFIPGKAVADLAIKGGTVRVIEVTIIATLTSQGLQAIEPLTQYTAFFVKSEGA